MFRRQKPYGASPRRRQKKGLIAQADLGTNHTLREHSSFRVPCQISDLGGIRKQLSEDAQSHYDRGFSVSRGWCSPSWSYAENNVDGK